MKNKMLAKIIAALLAILMVVGLLPLIASAEEPAPGEETPGTPGGTVTVEDDGLHLNKTAVLQADGTWTVTLEAYATGEVKREVKTQVTPTDIILVLDQSGSMTNSDYYIQIPSGTYTRVGNNSLPTNEQMASGTTTYYFYDRNDETYYPITTTRQMVKHDVYWALSSDGVTRVDADNVGTSWSYSNRTVNFEEGLGYRKSDFRLYQRTQSGNGNSRRYNYQLVQKGSDVTANINSNAFQTGVQNTNTAYQQLAALFPNQQVDSVTLSNTVYGVVYTPVKQVNNDVYYYTYSYVDNQGQTWIIGHSEQDDGAHENIADAKFNAAQLGNLYTQNSTSGPRLTALKNAANAFINDMRAAAATHQVDHRIAVVGFSGNDVSKSANNVQYQYMNSELFIGANQYNYYAGAAGDPASEYYDQAFQSVNSTRGYNNLIASVGALDGNGPTYTSVGFQLAQGVARDNAGSANDYKNGTRKLVVVFMTDGEPGWSSFEDDEAEDTVELARKLETDYNATVYTVALLGSAPSKGDDIDNFLNNVTSSGVTGTNGNKYTLAMDGVSLRNFFSSIEISVDTSISTVDLSQNAFLVDRVSEYFNMPAGLTVGNMKDYVSIYTADHFGNHEFGIWHKQDYEIAASADKENDLTADKIHAWPTYGATDGLVHGVTVHNFDYLSSDNMVTTEYLGYIDHVDNDPDGDVFDVPTVYEDKNNNGKYDLGDTVLPDSSGKLSGDELITMEKAAELEAAGQDVHYTMLASGKKIIVVIKGITAKDSAAQDYYVNTNHESSGLWDTVEGSTTEYGMLEAFPMPTAKLANRVYVLDYAKEALIDTTDSSRNAYGLSPSVENGTIYGFDRVNNAVNYNEDLLVTAPADGVKYGDANIKHNVGAGSDRHKVYYTPRTTNWDGYDTFYVFWESTDEAGADPVSGFGWTKVSVLPANNVYYEDSFVTSTADGQVGIVFDGWTEVFDGTSNPGSNDEVTEGLEKDGNDDHGWVDSLAGDSGYSDGSAHLGTGANGGGSKATFTFTGSGVDIYSRTDSTTGTILVQVTDVGAYTDGVSKPVTTTTENTVVNQGTVVTTKIETTVTRNQVPTQYFLVDTYSESGTYYQIPTISFAPKQKTTTHTVTTVTTVTGGQLTEDGFVIGGTTTTETSENTVVSDEAAHSKFTVTLTVTSAAGERLNYYLDGIRVYRPLAQAQENDPIVSGGYGNETDAIFHEVRDLLLQAGDFDATGMNTGVVFIDELTESQIPEDDNGQTKLDEPAAEDEQEASEDEETESQATEEPSYTATTTNVIGVYDKYGPKNEVYLEPGQSIVFKLNNADTSKFDFYIGLKAPNALSDSDTENVGPAVVSISKGSDKASVTISHSTDMYYKVIPDANGYVHVKNESGGLLAITKLRITGDPDTGVSESGAETANLVPSIASISGEEALAAVEVFRYANTVAYDYGTSGNEPETSVQPDVPEVPEVEITNPEPETPDQPSIDEQIRDQIAALVARLFKSVRDWFRY